MIDDPLGDFIDVLHGIRFRCRAAFDYPDGLLELNEAELENIQRTINLMIASHWDAASDGTTFYGILAEMIVNAENLERGGPPRRVRS